MLCLNCDESVSGHSRFCPNCGFRLNDSHRRDVDSRNRWLEHLQYQGEDFVLNYASLGQTLLDLNIWQNDLFYIGVTGRAGSGKSSFINAIRGINADDDDAAAVGCIETTMAATSYPLPLCDRVVLWDLPGVGTPRCPKNKYLKKYPLRKFSFFFIVSASRFTEHDLWLAKKITKTGRKFYFMRTKAATEIANDKRAHPRTHDAEKVIESIKKDCIDQLKEHGIENPEVFVTDNYKPTEFDFLKVVARLIDLIPTIEKINDEHVIDTDSDEEKANVPIPNPNRNAPSGHSNSDDSYCEIL